MTDSANENDYANRAARALHRRGAPTRPTAIPDLQNKTVRVTAHQNLTPAETRAYAVQLLYMADVAEHQDDGIGAFGYDPDDSRNLGVLRSLIDEHLGWETSEDEIEADYEARVIQVAEILKRRAKLTVVKP